MSPRKLKILRVILCICTFAIISGSTSWAIYWSDEYENTTQMRATCKSVELIVVEHRIIFNFVEYSYYKIELSEYDTYLIINYEDAIITTDGMDRLNAGDEIVFQIGSRWIDAFSDIEMIDIYALEKDSIQFISVESYTQLVFKYTFELLLRSSFMFLLCILSILLINTKLKYMESARE